MRVVGLVAPDARSLGDAIQLASGTKFWGQATPPVVTRFKDTHNVISTLFANDTLYVGVALCQEADAVDRSAGKDGEAWGMQAALALFCSSDAMVWATGLRTQLLAQLRLLQRAKVALKAAASLPPPPSLLILLQVAQGTEVAAQERWEPQLRRLLKSCRATLLPDNPNLLCRVPNQQLVVACAHLGGGSQRATIRAALRSLGESSGTEARPAQVASLPSVLGKLLPGAGGTVGASSLEDWQRAFSRLLEALTPLLPMEGTGAAKEALAGPLLASSLDPAWHCSRLLCQKAAAAAHEAYTQATPERYPAGVHAAALQAAGRLYTTLARGPAALEGARELQAACMRYWQAGHRRCEGVSLSEHPCVLAPHDPQTPHDSGLRLTLATASGRSQQAISDPFTWEDVQEALAGPLADAAPAARVPLHAHRMARGAAGALGPAQETGLAIELHHQEEGETLAQGSLRQLCPGMAAKHAVLHALPLQLSSCVEAAAQPPEEFPTLAAALKPAAPPPVEKPQILNWPWPSAAEARGGLAAEAVGSRGKPPGKASKKAPLPASGPALLVGAEYEAAVTGQRIVLSPQHLSTCLENSLDPVSLAPAAAAATATSAPPRLGPGAAEAAKIAAAAAVAGGSAAAFTLASDLPIFLQLPAASGAGSDKGAAARGQRKAAADPSSQWFQLRRLWISTPPGQLNFCSRPEVRLEAPPAALRQGRLAGASPIAVAYRPEAAVPLPRGSLCALSLPWFYSLPQQGGAGSLPPNPDSTPFKAFLVGGTALEPVG